MSILSCCFCVNHLSWLFEHVDVAGSAVCWPINLFQCYANVATIFQNNFDLCGQDLMKCMGPPEMGTWGIFLMLLHC